MGKKNMFRWSICVVTVFLLFSQNAISGEKWNAKSASARQSSAPSNRKNSRTKKQNDRENTAYTLMEKLTPEQVTRKIAKIRNRIEETPEDKISARDKKILLDVFDDMTQTQMGRWIFEKSDPNLNFAIQKTGQGMNGYYNQGSKTVNLGQMIFDQLAQAPSRAVKIQKTLYLAHVIAHESTHSVQGANRMNYPKGAGFPERLTINKVLELHSLLNENIVRYQMGQLPQYKAEVESGKVMLVPMHRFYRDLRMAKIAAGADEKNADRFARSKFVETFWKNDESPIQVGKTSITPPGGQGGVMGNWNTTYDLVPFRNRCLERNTAKFSMTLKGITNELRQFIDVMGIDTKPSFFTNPKTTAFRIISTQKLIGFTNGEKTTEYNALAVGYIIKVYQYGQLWKIIIDTRNTKAASTPEHRETYEENGSLRATYTCANGKMNGIYREYDMVENQILELPVKDNKVTGMAWTIENGQRVDKKFMNGFCPVKNRNPNGGKGWVLEEGQRVPRTFFRNVCYGKKGWKYEIKTEAYFLKRYQESQNKDNKISELMGK